MKVALSFLIPEFPLGFGLAFIGSVPMSGPVAVLFTDRLLRGDRSTAALIALGGALVEAGFALGIAFALPQLFGRTKLLVLVSLALGAIVITTLGLLLLLRPQLAQRFSGSGEQRGFVRGALSTLFNPTLLATWTLAVSTLYGNGWLSRHFLSALGFAVGVCLGSLAWFGILIGVTAIRRRSVAPEMRAKILRAMGGLLVVSGVFLCVRFVVELTHHGERRNGGLERAGRLLDEVSHRRNR
jgi:threonine/homoserine/homoserine lactone efflux protein